MPVRKIKHLKAFWAERPLCYLPRHPGVPVPRFPVPEFAVLGIPVPRIPASGIPVPGILVPEGRAALAATPRRGRSRGRLMAGRFRPPGPGRTAPGRTARGRTAPGRMAAGRMVADRMTADPDARRGRDGRGRRAAPERRAATAREAGPHHAKGCPAVAPRRGAAAGPPGRGHVAGRPGSRRAGSLAGQPGSRAGRPRAAGRDRLAGRPRLASSAPGMAWAADRPGPAMVPNRRPAPGPGTLRPDFRAAVERSPYGPRRAAVRSSRREKRRAKRLVVRCEKRLVVRRPRSAGERPREHPRTPGASWSPEGRRTRGTWPRPRGLACARRGERRSGHLANTRWSASVPVPASGSARTPPPGAGDQRAAGDATFRPW